MPENKCFLLVFLLLFLLVFNLEPCPSHAQYPMISDLCMELPPLYMDSEVLEASLLIQTPEGVLYRISRIMTQEGYSVSLVNSNAWYDGVPIYWGQSYVESALTRIKEMWEEVKGYVLEILQKIRDMMGIVGVILLLLSSGILTYFLNTAFPAFPARWTFYAVFLLLCLGWIYLTSIYSSVIYASGILFVPHLLIAFFAFTYRKTLGRFKRTPKME